MWYFFKSTTLGVTTDASRMRKQCQWVTNHAIIATDVKIFEKLQKSATADRKHPEFHGQGPMLNHERKLTLNSAAISSLRKVFKAKTDIEVWKLRQITSYSMQVPHQPISYRVITKYPQSKSGPNYRVGLKLCDHFISRSDILKFLALAKTRISKGTTTMVQ